MRVHPEYGRGCVWASGRVGVVASISGGDRRQLGNGSEGVLASVLWCFGVMVLGFRCRLSLLVLVALFPSPIRPFSLSLTGVMVLTFRFGPSLPKSPSLFPTPPSLPRPFSHSPLRLRPRSRSRLLPGPGNLDEHIFHCLGLVLPF